MTPQDRVAKFADGVRSSVHIAALTGLDARHVRKLMLRHDLPRRREGAGAGALNHQFLAGRIIDADGYVCLSTRPRVLEHRQAMSQTLGRDLLPQEVVDHIDGLHLHNAPTNLRLFASNAEHIRATLTGRVPLWSRAGRANMSLRHRQPEVLILVDTYRQRRAAGDVRLHQILLAALSLGIDSPYLLGTHHHMEKAGIDWRSRPNLERALQQLLDKWA
jgi:hypothetical protein